jgi:simple sugar transport system permease protein
MIVDFLIPLIVTIVNVSTPILLAATGELVAEKSGVLNLGVEGMMLLGAIAGFAITFIAGDPQYADSMPWLASLAPWLGVVAGGIAGMLGSLLFGVIVLGLGANQVATGLALVIFGGGVSSLIGTAYVGLALQPFDQIFPDSLAQDPTLKLVFGYSPMVYFSFFMVFAVYWFLNKTRAGLVLRAVGENDVSARSIGYSVVGVRYAAIAFGGAMAGIAGSFFSEVITPLWAEGMTAGRGWIALALVVFSGWRTGRLLLGAYFFGLFMTLELYAKASGFSFLPSQFWASMPYLMAIVVLALMSARERGGSEAPACLGKPYMTDA